MRYFDKAEKRKIAYTQLRDGVDNYLGEMSLLQYQKMFKRTKQVFWGIFEKKILIQSWRNSLQYIKLANQTLINYGVRQMFVFLKLSVYIAKSSHRNKEGVKFRKSGFFGGENRKQKL